jgi:hypothetical protein
LVGWPRWSSCSLPHKLLGLQACTPLLCHL